jgi:alpha-galactosidase
MKFGIWVEPEMVSEDSELYRAHPDWAYVIPGRKPVRGRSQLVLDFSRREVVDHVYDQVSKVLDSAAIEYIKWDMNRSITDVYSATAGRENQGAVLYRYVLGLYEFLERIHTNYPDVLVEGCSGGGGRFDAGMLYYTPQIWCSDNTDAIDRVRIQYGTSFGFPISAVGAHVSASPNHQNGRVTSIETRGLVAMAGSFGYELDLNKITPEEKECVRNQIKEFHKYWNVIHNGDYYRLTNPFEPGEAAAWMFVAEDKSEALLQAVTLESHGNSLTTYIRLKGLEPEAFYMDEETGKSYSGAGLMDAGIPMPRLGGEYRPWQLHLKREE